VTDSNGFGRDRVSSNIAGLDEILCGGSLKGGIYI
jgi:hypothetical protein